jgi:quinol monooxygenase YgiN
MMYGLIGKMTSKPSQRYQLITILLEGSQHMPGCISYLGAKDSDDQDGIWVREVWDNQTGEHEQRSHQAKRLGGSIENCSIAQA